MNRDKLRGKGNNNMNRTQQEWYNYCMNRGTSKDQVFDILNDWEEDVEKLFDDVTGKKELVHKLRRIGWTPTICWISPTTCIKYTFEDALRIENLEESKTND